MPGETPGGGGGPNVTFEHAEPTPETAEPEISDTYIQAGLDQAAAHANDLNNASKEGERSMDQPQPVNNINARVIAIQENDNVDVGSDWWEANVTAKVGNDASEQAMFQAFMTAYERDFPKDAQGRRQKRAGA